MKQIRITVTCVKIVKNGVAKDIIDNNLEERRMVGRPI